MLHNVEKQLEYGPQPLIKVLEELGLEHKGLVKVSSEHLTFKMIGRACRGRRLTRRVQFKILRALNALAGEREYQLKELFNY